MFRWLDKLAATAGEWQWCIRCEKITLSWFRKVRHFGKIQRRPICARCKNWKPFP